MDSNEVKMLMTAVLELANEVKEIKKSTMELKKLVNQMIETKEHEVVPAINAQNYSEYKIEIPISNIYEFHAFDKKLKDDKQFQKFVVHHLRTLIDYEDSLVRNITNIMKFFFTKHMTLSFTAVRKSEDKEIFKDTTFCDCVESVVSKNKPNDCVLANRKKYFKAIGSVFLNAKDWAGGRTARRKRVPDESMYEDEQMSYQDFDMHETLTANNDAICVKEEIEPDLYSAQDSSHRFSDN